MLRVGFLTVCRAKINKRVVPARFRDRLHTSRLGPRFDYRISRLALHTTSTHSSSSLASPSCSGEWFCSVMLQPPLIRNLPDPSLAVERCELFQWPSMHPPVLLRRRNPSDTTDRHDLRFVATASNDTLILPVLGKNGSKSTFPAPGSMIARRQRRKRRSAVGDHCSHRPRIETSSERSAVRIPRPTLRVVLSARPSNVTVRPFVLGVSDNPPQKKTSVAASSS